jgi:HEAT repeat protein
VVLLIVVFVIAAVSRRVWNRKKYEKLDRLRAVYNEKLKNIIYSEISDPDHSEFTSRPNSLKWQAVEEVLLALFSVSGNETKVKKLFVCLGYIAFYEKMLSRSSVITRSAAIDKLGRMMSKESVDKLIEMLLTDNTEIVTVTMRSLSRIQSLKGLNSILSRLPDLIENRLVSHKAVETSLESFGNEAISLFVDYGRLCKEPEIISIILEVLFNFQSGEVLSFASEMTKHEDAEVRAKAAKIIGSVAADSPEFDAAQLMPLLNDDVWFVKLQAIKSLGNLRYGKSSDVLGVLLLDERWQIRNAAAIALSNIGDIAISVMLKTLSTTNDSYVKECICEEIGKTDLVNRLIENLDGKDESRYYQSKEILEIMHSLNFSTPLYEYCIKGSRDQIKIQIYTILEERLENESSSDIFSPGI